jgi:glycosyltransferase involved in cell wall biosynthesis
LIVVTVPACNESRNLRKCVESLLHESLSLNEEFRVVIAEDGSTDGTDIVAESLESMHPRVIHFHSAGKLGRGLALKRAWNKLDADIYAFVDCDLATDMKYFPQLINTIREGNDLATGSRYIAGAKVDRPFLRDVTSKVYNMLIRMMYKDKVYDHQIGFKAFSKRLIRDELNRCKSDNWFWDTEIIIRSIHDKYNYVEFPVEWKEKKGKRTSLKRLLSDIMIHGLGIIRLKDTLYEK